MSSEISNAFSFPEGGEEAYESLRATLLDYELAVTEHRIRNVTYVHHGEEMVAEVGKSIFMDGGEQTVLAIFELKSKTLCICTPQRGALVDFIFKTPIMVGLEEIQEVVYYPS